MLAALYKRLKDLGRDDDADKAMLDVEARKRFYSEFNMKN